MAAFKSNDFSAKLATNESYFNHGLLWPILEMAVDSCGRRAINFIPGEHILRASKEEYKADAVVVNGDGQELLLLETSGKYLLEDVPRFSYDHVKGCFGVLTMLNATIKKYNKATVHTILGLQLPFIHARGHSVHLWGFELCDEKLYVLKKLYVAEVPTSWNDTSDIVSLGVLTWNVSKMLAKLADVCQTIQEEHEAYETGKLLGVVEEDRDLSSFIDTSIKRPIKGSKYGVLLPHDKSCSIKYSDATSI